MAVELAGAAGGEIVSVDSMQVYREMDIGTAKPDEATRQRVPHHLIDLADPEAEFTVSAFQRAGRAVLDRLATVATKAVIAGGSGLHFRALVDPMSFGPTDADTRRELEEAELADLVTELLAADPAADVQVDLANPRRVVRAVEMFRLTGVTPTERAATAEHRALRDYEPVVPFRAVGLDPGDALATRVERRFDAMLDAGLLDEVASLAGRVGRTARQAVGYKELLPVVAGRAGLADGRAAAIRATLALAKRQRTFFRRDPRIRWLPWQEDPVQRLAAAREILEEERVWTS